MKTASPQRGFAMIEVLVTMLIIAFGILGFVGLQANSTLAQVEAYQRSQAIVLVSDIAQRIQLNHPDAASYVGTNIGTTAPGDCATQPSLAARDLCEWSLLIQGASETLNGSKLGAVMGARGCITSPAANQYVITLAWQGVRASGAPHSPCGQNAYTAENLRRVVSTSVQVATLGS
jgi:type IV pilus assembly protein PilV